ncbi:MAG: DUF134 domain-containing protein [Candidatus Dojkabacteria bacterium]|nr:DUF134 domain-containing protein [Candidatus Dojkabacteria bacterium]
MRRRIRRRLQHTFKDYYFKPRGIPLTALDEVKVTDEELETLRLRFINDLDQNEAAKQMQISQSQYQRDFVKAMEKITKALIEGKAILIERKQA